MKKYIVPLVALSICCNTVQAQSKQKAKPAVKHIVKKEETVIIKNDDNSPQTVIEIKNGNVYINGENVADINSTRSGSFSKKIIIDRNENMQDEAGRPQMQENFFRDEPSSGKAMLGVYTARDSRDSKGAEIERVMPNSGADKAGLKSGDVIMQVNGREVTDGKELTEIISNHDAGDKVTIIYDRDGKRHETDATLSESMPNDVAHNYRFSHPFMNPNDIPTPMRPFWMDINDEPSVTPKLGVVAEETADGEGVRVAEVRRGSAAEKAGLQEDDIVTKLDDERISSVGDIREVLRNSRDTEHTLQYMRDGKAYTIDIDIPRPKSRQDF